MSAIYTTSEDAEEAFYNAVGRGDLDTLMDVWADDEEIVSIDPAGQRLAGAAAIREGWRTIFESSPRFSIHIRRKVRWESMLIAVHSVIETIHLEKDHTIQGTMLSTNVFLRGANGWRLLSRHTSAAAEGAEAGNEIESRHHTLH